MSDRYNYGTYSDSITVAGTVDAEKIEISPQGATVPTASSLAIQDNTASGNLVSIKSTPASSSTANLLKIEADGTNFGAANCIYVLSDDTSAAYLRTNNGSADKHILYQSGAFYSSGDYACGGNLELTGGGSVTSTSNGNITLLPNGTGITIVGDAGSTSHSLAANDDLFVSGKLEVDGATWCDGAVVCASTFTASSSTVGLRYVNINDGHTVAFQSSSGSALNYKEIDEEVTIPVGSGLDPVVVSSSNLAPVDSIIKVVAVRITQAPGGGATTLDIGRTNGGNLDEFIDGMAVTLGTTANSIVENDGVLAAEDLWNATADTFTLTTDADVTDTDMKVRIVVWYEQITEPTS